VDIGDALDLVVLDPGALTDLSATCRKEFVAELQKRSRPGSVHIVLPCCPTLAPEALLTLYDGWTVEEDGRRRRRSGGRRPDGLALSKPTCLPDTELATAHRVVTTRPPAESRR
jgi:hypothetical protein